MCSSDLLTLKGDILAFVWIKHPMLKYLLSMLKLHVFAGANNLIPMEIALKIAAKIRANERLAVYIVIPMWRQRVFQLVLPLKEFYFGRYATTHKIKANFQIMPLESC